MSTDISGEARERIKELLPGQAGKHGGVAKDSRLFINAAARQTRTSAPRRDIPPEFGNRNSVHKRFCRRRDKGIWKTPSGCRNRRACRVDPYDRFDIYQGHTRSMRGARR
ncbi:transposase [Treponema endosymbiont of Eucomonympha sp.]|uniref:transposase n=1 Tax=Treponema endosymbiont of Eucomonympha sp. TaxID=1580831 RepID=UPI0013968C0E|nr:transposase [Treponema endosymbiont of Eucomonympha sp.]